MSLYRHGDGLLTRNGALTSSSECCTCPPDCQCVLDPEPIYFPKPSNRYNQNCCAYLSVTVAAPGGGEDRIIPTPIGMFTTSTWAGVEWGDGYAGFNVQSECQPAGFLDGLLGVGGVRNGPSSIIMTLNPSVVGWLASDAVVEIFRDDNCCPVDIQVYYYSEEGYDNPILDVTLEFGPAVFANFFFDGWIVEAAGKDYDLYICGDPPLGLCCVNETWNIGRMTEYECKVGGGGAGIGPGETRTWYADGTYDPESPPCAENPFP